MRSAHRAGTEAVVVMRCITTCVADQRYQGPIYNHKGELVQDGAEAELTRDVFIRELAKGRNTRLVKERIPNSDKTYDKREGIAQPKSPYFAHFVWESGPDDLRKLYDEAFVFARGGIPMFNPKFKRKLADLLLFVKKEPEFDTDPVEDDPEVFDPKDDVTPVDDTTPAERQKQEADENKDPLANLTRVDLKRLARKCNPRPNIPADAETHQIIAILREYFAEHLDQAAKLDITI